MAVRYTKQQLVQKKRLASSYDKWERVLKVKQFTAKDWGQRKPTVYKT
jgi:hypothetical protein